MKTVASRLACVDFLRGIAVLLVFGSHVRISSWSGMTPTWNHYGLLAPLDVWLGYLSYPFRFGFGGVILFFVISGYCIHRSNTRHFPSSSPLVSHLGGYFSRRFFRIYPTLFFALLFTFALDALGRRYGSPATPIYDNSIHTFFLNLASLQSYYLKNYGSNYPLWSLGIEEHIYLIYPLMLWFMRRFGSLKMLLITCLISSLTTLATEYNIRLHLDFLPYWFSWTLGAMVAEEGENKLNFPFLSSKWLLTATFVGFVWFYLKGYSLFAQLSLSVSAACLLYQTLKLKDHLFFLHPVNRAITHIGLMSYSIYILHVPLLTFWENVVMYGNRPMSFLPSLMGGTVTLALTIVFYYMIEHWSLKWLQWKKEIQLPLNEDLSQAA